MPRSTWATVLGFTLLAACRSPAPPSPTSAPLFRGHYSTGFEIREFVPCGQPEVRWWLTTGDADLEARLEAEIGRVVGPPASGTTYVYRTVYLEAEADTTPVGRYGHLGQSQRELRVRRLRTIAPEATNCPA